MPRGGRRKGTPGKAYGNRTDLMKGYNPTTGLTTPAAGGQDTPPAPQGGTGGPPMPMGPGPDQTPNLTDPTALPHQPVTAGLPNGPGPGPQQIDPRVAETQKMKKWLPILKPVAADPETPESVRMLVRYIEGR